MFILNILCDLIHDLFIKHVYDIVRDKLSTFCVLMYLPSLNLKTVLHNSLDLNRLDYVLHMGCSMYSSLFTDNKFETLNT